MLKLWKNSATRGLTLTTIKVAKQSSSLYIERNAEYKPADSCLIMKMWYF